MRMFITVIVVCMSAAAAPGQWNAAAPEIERAEAMLSDAGIRSDAVGIELARTRLEKLCGDERLAARAHRACAFAGMLATMSGGADADEIKRAVDRALEHIDKALALSDDGDSTAVWVMTRWPLMRREPQKAGAIVKETMSRLARAVKAEPSNPRLALVQGMMEGGGPGAKITASVKAHFERANELFAKRPREGLADWWEVSALGWLGQMHMAADEPDVAKARALFLRVLELRPDNVLTREYFLPQTDVRTPVPVAGVPSDWTTLAEDARGDGQRPAGHDGRDVAFARKGDDVWFRVRYHDLSAENFGLNLVLDIDGDAGNGMEWWSGVTDFRFDRLVTVWLRRVGGTFFGTVGTADSAEVESMRLRGEPSVAPRFAIDERTHTVYVAVPRAALGDGTPRVLAAVGGSSWWNDDIGAPAVLRVAAN